MASSGGIAQPAIDQPDLVWSAIGARIGLQEIFAEFGMLQSPLSIRETVHRPLEELGMVRPQFPTVGIALHAPDVEIESEPEAEPDPETFEPTLAALEADVLCVQQELADLRSRRSRLRLRNRRWRLLNETQKVERECDRLNEEGLELLRARRYDEICGG